MPVTDNQLREIFDRSFGLLLRQDAGILRRNINERTVCGRLAIYFERFASEAGLRGYFADVEYNRNQNCFKTIIDGRGVEIRITCDLILHSRAVIAADDNLIAVEVKKRSHSEKSKNADRMRLRALTTPNPNPGQLPEQVCGYRLGMLLIVDCATGNCSVEYYRDGRRVDE